MIWENGIETCEILYVKQIASPGSMHDTGRSGLVHWGTRVSFNSGFPQCVCPEVGLLGLTAVLFPAF